VSTAKISLPIGCKRLLSLKACKRKKQGTDRLEEKRQESGFGNRKVYTLSERKRGGPGLKKRESEEESKKRDRKSRRRRAAREIEQPNWLGVR